MTHQVGPAEQEALLDALSEHRSRFAEWFGDGAGVRLFYSPGRVNLMGAHLDYNGGPVMPTAIDRGTFFAVRARSDRRLALASLREGEGFSQPIESLPDTALGRWYDYPLGVARHLLRERTPPHGLDVLVGGSLPIGAGLSSSASICVGTAFAFDAVWELGATIHDCIESALWSEREFVGVRCGIMDPHAVGLTRPGSLLWLDCKDRSIEHLPLDAGAVSIAVADSGLRRDLAKGAFNRRVAQCAAAFEALRAHVPGATCLRDIPLEVVDAHAGELSQEQARRARHVAAEVERTFVARDALRAGQLELFGSQISAAHESLRDLYEVSIPELDALVEAARSWDGVLGARLTGAGFGGCVVVLLRREAREGFAEHLERAFRARFARPPTVELFHGDAGPREIELDG